MLLNAFPRPGRCGDCCWKPLPEEGPPDSESGQTLLDEGPPPWPMEAEKRSYTLMDFPWIRTYMKLTRTATTTTKPTPEAMTMVKRSMATGRALVFRGSKSRGIDVGRELG